MDSRWEAPSRGGYRGSGPRPNPMPDPPKGPSGVSRTKHCGWCGRYVARNTLPTPGTNAHGQIIEQTLCPECAAEWLDLSAQNLARLARDAGQRRQDGQH